MQLISDLAFWVLEWADSPWGAVALFVLAFWESSFFPLPPTSDQHPSSIHTGNYGTEY